MKKRQLLFFLSIVGLSIVATFAFGGPMDSGNSYSSVQNSNETKTDVGHLATLSGRATTPQTFISEDGISYFISDKNIGQKLYRWSQVVTNKITLTGTVHRQGNDMYLKIHDYDLYACNKSNAIVSPLETVYRDYFMGPEYAQSCRLSEVPAFGG
jgi:hypothetical protein